MKGSVYILGARFQHSDSGNAVQNSPWPLLTVGMETQAQPQQRVQARLTPPWACIHPWSEAQPYVCMLSSRCPAIPWSFSKPLVGFSSLRLSFQPTVYPVIHHLRPPVIFASDYSWQIPLGKGVPNGQPLDEVKWSQPCKRDLPGNQPLDRSNNDMGFEELQPRSALSGGCEVFNMIVWRGHGNPLQYSCPENPHEQRSLAGNSRKELDTTERLSTAQQNWEEVGGI